MDMERKHRKDGTAMETPRYVREYVKMEVDFISDGRMLPTALIWENGRRYEIDRICDVRHAPALKAGGMGSRFTVRIAGRERYLFFEHSADPRSVRPGRWFVERRVG